MQLNRRSFLQAASTSAALWNCNGAIAADTRSLRVRASAKGIAFGCAVKSQQLKDPVFAGAVAREASILVPEYELKREIVDQTRGKFDFAGAEAILDFAAKHKQTMRGHTLAWYAANPKWVEDAVRQGDTATRRKLLVDYITQVMKHFRGRIPEWDVVNEPVDPDQGRADGMRARNVWQEAFTERYIDLAFHTAREADPGAKLFLNEFGIEGTALWEERKRTAILKLLDRMKARDVPIDGFGMQAHLKPYKSPIDQRRLSDFVTKLSDYGLRLSITELDFLDRGGATDPAKRDADMAASAKAFLDVVLDNRSVRSVLTWGITDRYSWLSSKWNGDRWPEGQFARGLPLDIDYRKKPLYWAIASALDSAPAR